MQTVGMVVNRTMDFFCIKSIIFVIIILLMVTKYYSFYIITIDKLNIDINIFNSLSRYPIVINCRFLRNFPVKKNCLCTLMFMIICFNFGLKMIEIRADNHPYLEDIFILTMYLVHVYIRPDIRCGVYLRSYIQET